ncbi:MazG nucleotide pyrophosphohydrolase domain-containing protein [Streptococcus cuniculi]|uniref:NTP pyrophosphohydrolase MazG-like domain-containing protein n=1 Tax=Streptococcus cuniculi TaxID=1432788 RepID=A0A4Y9JED5_9STRE|nr:MazG-like family protein [Streptococcus cuniculi]MBF0777920.1 MazG-like family protein [Streptococcus cuniculi]TFU98215.1 hypothetical protein E4T82_04205 [Streptococcus cuniculi]
MDIREYQEWVSRFYKERNWYAYNSFIRTNFLCEEVGELAQAIRKMEIGRDRPDEPISNQEENLGHIREELGDVLDNLFIIADTYQISLEDIMNSHKEKLEERFKGQ